MAVGLEKKVGGAGSAVGAAQVFEQGPGAGMSFTVDSRTPSRVATDGDRESGDEEQPLGTAGPGSRVNEAEVRVTGKAFEGWLKFLKGAKVIASPVIYDSAGHAQTPSADERAFIVDFTGIRSLLTLQIQDSQGLITLVLSWMGTEFASKALYPVMTPTSGQFLPKKDTTGAPVVYLSGVETSKVLVQVQGGSLTPTTFAENCWISTATYPTNVKASLNGRLPFWTHPGVLSETAQLTGLVEDLNVLLKDATSAVEVNLLLNTDTPGVLKVDFNSGSDLDISESASARWGGQESIEVPLRAAEVEPFALSFPRTSERPWLVHKLELNLSGRFPPWRAKSGQDNDVPGPLGMKVCARFSVARRCDFSQDGELFGFSILLRPATEGAEIMLEVAAGKDGEPVAGKSLAEVNAVLEASTTTVPRWVDVLFAAPIKVVAKQELWLTLKAGKGAVEWCGLAAPANSDTATLYSDEGEAWQRYPPVEREKFAVAQMRTLRRPFSNENDPLLQISWGRSPRVSLDLTEETRSVELSRLPAQVQQVAPENGAILVPLRLIAGASGSITIKGATAFYKEKSAP